LSNEISAELVSSLVMVVSVKFYGVHRALTSTREIQVPLLKDGRVSDVISHIKGCFPALQLSEKDVLVSVNNKVSHMDQVLMADDKITFLPHIGGG
jgi:molybdopterin converting factor small subunit